MIYSWNDIKRRRRCPSCHHSMKKHKRVDALSNTLEVDIWICSDCRAEGHACASNGKIDINTVKGRAKEPFQGGKL